jgi:hypothetical protein
LKGSISALAVTEDGLLLVSTSADGAARVWDTSSRVCVRVFDAHKGASSARTGVCVWVAGVKRGCSRGACRWPLAAPVVALALLAARPTAVAAPAPARLQKFPITGDAPLLVRPLPTTGDPVAAAAARRARREADFGALAAAEYGGGAGAAAAAAVGAVASAAAAAPAADAAALEAEVSMGAHVRCCVFVCVCAWPPACGHA